jgi:hypothetical protein
VAAEREQYERMMQKQSRLNAASEAHARNVADRDRFMRELALRTGLMQLPGSAQLSSNTVAAYVTLPHFLPLPFLLCLADCSGLFCCPARVIKGSNACLFESSTGCARIMQVQSGGRRLRVPASARAAGAEEQERTKR